MVDGVEIDAAAWVQGKGKFALFYAHLPQSARVHTVTSTTGKPFAARWTGWSKGRAYVLGGLR